MPENHAAEIKSLSQYLQVHAESMLFARLAEKYLRMDEIDKAMEVCVRGLRNHPNYPSAHYVLAKCYMARRQFDEAEKRLKHVCKLEPSFLPAHKMYGDLLARMGQTMAQSDRYHLIHRVDPLAPVKIADEPERGAMVRPEPAGPIMADKPRESFPPPQPPVLSQPVPPEFLPPAQTVTPPEQPLQAVLHIPEEEELPPSFEAAAFYETPAESEPVAQAVRTVEVDTLPELDEPEDSVSAETEFEQEEVRFSLILDDLFSPNLEEEQKREQQARTTLERAAQQEPPVRTHTPGTPETRPQVIRPAETAKPNAFPERQITGSQTFNPPAAPPESRVTPDPYKTFEPRQKPVAPASMPSPDVPSREKIKPDTPPPQQLPVVRSLPQSMDDEKSTPLPKFGPDFSTYPEVGEEDDLNAFIDHLDRMAARDMEPAPKTTRPEATDEINGFSSVESREEAMDESDLDGHDPEKTKDKFVTPTLGEIYAAQGQYAKAISVFEMLLKKNPENEWYRTKLDYLRKRQAEDKN